jgi:hypothetical protein
MGKGSFYLLWLVLSWVALEGTTCLCASHLLVCKSTPCLVVDLYIRYCNFFSRYNGCIIFLEVPVLLLCLRKLAA